MNSGPLSLRIHWGTPLSENSLAKVLMTSSLANAAINIQGHTLSGVLVDDREPLQHHAIGRVIKRKVPAPDMVLELGSASMATILTGSQTTLLSLLLGTFSPSRRPERYTRVTHSPTVAQQASNSAIAETGRCLTNQASLSPEPFHHGEAEAHNAVCCVAGPARHRLDAGNVKLLLELLHRDAFFEKGLPVF
ncbi:MAG: hypothetical protein R3C18_17615 [Planctomycetaceae bacterium]